MEETKREQQKLVRRESGREVRKEQLITARCQPEKGKKTWASTWVDIYIPIRTRTGRVGEGDQNKKKTKRNESGVRVRMMTKTKS